MKYLRSWAGALSASAALFCPAHAADAIVKAVPAPTAEPGMDFRFRYRDTLYFTEGDRVTGFQEKPQVQGFVNGGFFVFERGVFDYLPDEGNIDLEKEPLEQMARDGQLMVYRHTGFWRAMDTLKDAEVLNEMWKTGQAPWKVWS